MGIIGGVASAIIGKRSADKAAKQAMTGFNYLRDNPLFQQTQEQGLAAGTNINALLGLGGDQAAADQAFEQYRGSTGYQFRLGQGTSAITQNRAASGLLNSGSTLKGITDYGQNIASAEFQNYLGQLGSVQGTGLNSAQATGSAGSSAGAAAGGFTREGAADVSYGLNRALQGVSNYTTRPAADTGRGIFGY